MEYRGQMPNIMTLSFSYHSVHGNVYLITMLTYSSSEQINLDESDEGAHLGTKQRTGAMQSVMNGESRLT